MRPSNPSLKLSPPQLCQPTSIHTLPPTLLVSPPTCRRLNVQCDLKNSGIVVQSLAIRFPPTLSPNSHTPSLSFLACYLVTSSCVLVLSSFCPPTTQPDSTVAQPLISPPSIYPSSDLLLPSSILSKSTRTLLAACSCMSIERLSSPLFCHEGLALPSTSPFLASCLSEALCHPSLLPPVNESRRWDSNYPLLPNWSGD